MSTKEEAAIIADTNAVAIAKQLLALVVQARRISALVGKLPDDGEAKKSAEAA